jgi:putative membrane protein
MGAANVIPGVSGGTVALITGIFEKLIDSIKSFDLTALKLLLTGKFRQLARHINLDFLVAVFAGVAISILTLARLFDFLFKSYPHYIWSFFFGLILASVFFVGKTVEKWRLSVIISLIIGTAFAFSVSVLSPASENSSLLYLFICGIIAACSMILPGLSGSFVLILLGNYQLVMIDSINDLNLLVLLPVVLGAVIGLLAFSHVLSWVFKKFKDQTIALLTGFILGSMGILWPWKHPEYKHDALGHILLKKSGEKVVSGYDWYIPDTWSTAVIVAVLLMIAGIFTIYLLEKSAQTVEES